MKMKTVCYRDKLWAWPDYDVGLESVIDWVEDIPKIMAYVDNHSVCVQAGGACGVWPYYFAKYFEVVYTFEPHPDNFKCMVQNVDREYVGCQQAALGAEEGTGSLAIHETELGNAGAYYIRNGDDVKITTIDNLQLPNCGLIQLDVEGSELDALVGAQMTLKRCRPTVVIEIKPLPQLVERGESPTAAHDFLKTIGYQPVRFLHRDVVYTC
jgi:FkbM family methyltransferase